MNFLTVYRTQNRTHHSIYMVDHITSHRGMSSAQYANGIIDFRVKFIKIYRFLPI